MSMTSSNYERISALYLVCLSAPHHPPLSSLSSKLPFTYSHFAQPPRCRVLHAYEIWRWNKLFFSRKMQLGGKSKIIMRQMCHSSDGRHVICICNIYFLILHFAFSDSHIFFCYVFSQMRRVKFCDALWIVNVWSLSWRLWQGGCYCSSLCCF